MSIEGVYNHTNKFPIDLSEIFLLNYAGIALITADLLKDNWTCFHEENSNNPDAKYLQFAHSMGTILTKVALSKSPQEIRDRIIVVAIGPAAVIPEGLCYRAFHYACKNDYVNLGESSYKLFLAGSDESDQGEFVQQLFETQQKIIMLDPHPDSKGWGHGFEDPTFFERISEHVQDYLEKEGQYR